MNFKQLHFWTLKRKDGEIMIADILFVEAGRNYSCIFTGNLEYVLTVTLKTIEDKFLRSLFLRIHRSYIINVLHVDEVVENYVVIPHKTVSMGAGLKEQFMQRINTL